MTDHSNILLLIVFIFFATVAAVQLFYYLYFYLAVGINEGIRIADGPFEPVSVIICARNEAENLMHFLPAVLEQEYPDFEVIVVNDCSEDNSYDVLGKFLKKYPHLKVSTINKDPKFSHNKKFAQFIGIKAARNEILLFTDADCKPESNQWLKEMTSHFSETTDFVLGYGGYFGEQGLLNKYVRADSMFIAMQYLGMALRGIPYMGVGRNLAYKRSVFFRNKGFGSYSHLVSGDDDLLVNAMATGDNTFVELSAAAHTRSVPAATEQEWFTRKKRHLTTAPYYKLKHKILLIAEPLCRMFFYISCAVLLSFLFMWIWVLAIFTLRLIAQIIVLALAGKKLNERGLLTYLLIFDIFSPLVNSVIFISSRSSSARNKWN